MEREVRLASNAREREQYDNLADLFSIIKTTELLEKAYVRDAISAQDYTPACSKLIAQFRTALNLVDTEFDVQQFMTDYRLDCRAAYDRLVSIRLPATIEHPDLFDNESRRGDTAKHIAEVVEYFITAMDGLKLEMTAVDQIQPLLVDLLSSLGKVSTLPADFEGTEKVKTWLTKINTMRASEELNEEEVRQLLFDLESSYNAFHRSLKSS